MHLNVNIAQPPFIKTMEAVYSYLTKSWCSREKAKLIMDLITSEQLYYCVEVGTYTGSTALPVLVSLKHMKKGRAYLIDAWSNREALRGLHADDPNTAWWSTVDMNMMKTQLVQMLDVWELSPYYTVLHSTSEKAVTNLAAIDFLHLDGNFTQQGALNDSRLYLPKVRTGGYILLSNVLVIVNQQYTKMQSLWPLFETCDIVSEIDEGNTLLFRKK